MTRCLKLYRIAAAFQEFLWFCPVNGNNLRGGVIKNMAATESYYGQKSVPMLPHFNHAMVEIATLFCQTGLVLCPLLQN